MAVPFGKQVRYLELFITGQKGQESLNDIRALLRQVQTDPSCSVACG